MTPEEFIAWRKAAGLTQITAAEALELGRTTVQDYEKGKYPIPRTVALACAAIYHNIGEWKPQ